MRIVRINFCRDYEVIMPESTIKQFEVEYSESGFPGSNRKYRTFLLGSAYPPGYGDSEYEAIMTLCAYIVAVLDDGTLG